MKKFFVIIAVLGLSTLIGGTDSAFAETTFPDVEEDAWFYPYIMELVEDGVASGYPDGRFGSWDPINRAELAKMLVLYKQQFKGHWLKDNVVEIVLVLATVFGWIYILSAFQHIQPNAKRSRSSSSVPSGKRGSGKNGPAIRKKGSTEGTDAIEKNLNSNWWT